MHNNKSHDPPSCLVKYLQCMYIQTIFKVYLLVIYNNSITIVNLILKDDKMNSFNIKRKTLFLTLEVTTCSYSGCKIILLRCSSF